MFPLFTNFFYPAEAREAIASARHSVMVASRHMATPLPPYSTEQRAAVVPACNGCCGGQQAANNKGQQGAAGKLGAYISLGKDNAFAANAGQVAGA